MFKRSKKLSQSVSINCGRQRNHEGIFTPNVNLMVRKNKKY